MKKIKQAFVSVLLTLMLSGCGSLNVPEFSDMSTRYTEVLEQYQINMIFQNIVRAANARPLSFLDIPNINGSGNVSYTPSVSPLFNGGAIPANALGSNIVGGLASISPTLGLSLGKTVNFSQASLDNSVFWKGFLTTLPAETLSFYIHNHIAPELFYSLVLDEIKIQDTDGIVHTYINNPLHETHPEFQRQMYQLIRNGLAPKYAISSVKIGGVVNEARLQQMYGAKYRDVITKDGLTLVQVGAESQKRFQIVSTDPGVKFCLKKNLYVNFEQGITRNDYCQVAPITEDDIQDPSKKGERLYIKTRSTSNIYAYLGDIVNAQLQSTPYLVTVPPVGMENNPEVLGSPKYAVLLVQENIKTVRPFAYIDDQLSGNSYLIPQKDSGYSRRTIQILSEFQTLQKIPGSVSPSPAILIR